MAEKKFFVDINLQGSALTNAKIGTNSGIGSTEGAFGYDSASHRLQYFNGTATKDVANLSDISAVTGGLIFQGGYDPTTDTPDITDGTALKGFFWVATAAGTFLGESVQVGDSIVAKVNAAGATITDWLILQGNVVIATDSVDGISRLATQAEADAGTEAGAVVITPATLQGKIDAQITPEISNKLPLAGGTMSGNIDMGGNNIENAGVVQGTRIRFTEAEITELSSYPAANITLNNSIDADNAQTIINLPAPTNGGDATNKTYVDDQDALKLSLTGGTMTGAIDMGNHNINSIDALTADTLTATGFHADYLFKNGNDSIGLGDNLDAQNIASIINLPAPTNDGDATNKQYVDNNTSNKLPLAGGTMSGNINMDGGTIENSGAVYTNNLASSLNTEIQLLNDLHSFNGSKITNLPAPTDDGDAANKLYVDNAASTAESNANTYTDTAINSTSYSTVIVSADWTLRGFDNAYYVTINHNLGSYPLFSAWAAGTSADFTLDNASPNTGSTTILSNILPTENITISFVKANGNGGL
jgi:hypothetical protein